MLSLLLFSLGESMNEGFCFSSSFHPWVVHLFGWVLFVNCRELTAAGLGLSVIMSTSLMQEILQISPQYSTHLFSNRLELIEELFVSFSVVSSFVAPIAFFPEWCLSTDVLRLSLFQWDFGKVAWLNLWTFLSSFIIFHLWIFWPGCASLIL